MLRSCAFGLLGVLLLLPFTSAGPPEIRSLASDRGSTPFYQPMTEEAYARENSLSVGEVRKRFAASGVIRCPGGSGSAQVTGARDVITTAAHVFRDACKPKPPDKCTFEYYLGTEKRAVPLSTSLWMGSCFEHGSKAIVGDWAVATLQVPAEVTPYEIYERTEILVELERVLAVVGYDIEAAGKTDKYGPFNKTMQECQVRDVRDWSIFETNCEFTVGASGSALFRLLGSRMTLFGVLSGDYHDQEYCPRGSCAFRSRRWSSVYVTLKGEFKDRLLAAVSQSDAK